MNRRDAIKAAAAFAGAAGVGHTTAQAMTKDDEIVLLVVSTENHLRHETAIRLSHELAQRLKDSALKDVPCLVLDGGLTLKAYSRQGLIDATG